MRYAGALQLIRGRGPEPTEFSGCGGLETCRTVTPGGGSGKLHAFPLDEMRQLSGGGRGVQTLVPDPRDRIIGLAAASHGVVVSGTGRAGRVVELSLSMKDLREYTGHRARKGRQLAARIKPTGLRASSR